MIWFIFFRPHSPISLHFCSFLWLVRRPRPAAKSIIFSSYASDHDRFYFISQKPFEWPNSSIFISWLTCDRYKRRAFKLQAWNSLFCYISPSDHFCARWRLQTSLIRIFCSSFHNVFSISFEFHIRLTLSSFTSQIDYHLLLLHCLGHFHLKIKSTGSAGSSRFLWIHFVSSFLNFPTLPFTSICSFCSCASVNRFLTFEIV